MRPQITLRQLELRRVLHLNQIQAVGMGSDAAGTPITCGEHLGHPAWLAFAGTDGGQKNTWIVTASANSAGAAASRRR